MPCDVLVKQPLPVLPADAAMTPDLCLQVGEYTLQGIVCPGKPGLRVLLERPVPLHVALHARVRASETGPHVRRCLPLYPPVLYPPFRTSWYFSYQSSKTDAKDLPSFFVMPFTRARRSLDASSSGSCVR